MAARVIGVTAKQPIYPRLDAQGQTMAQWTRRQVMRAACAAAIAGSMPARSGAATPSADAVLSTVASLPPPDDALILMLPDGCQSNVEPLRQQFLERTGIAIDFHAVPVNDVNTRLLLANGRNERIDLALPASYGIPDLVEAGALRPFEDTNAAEGARGSRSLYALSDVYNQQLYGLQTDGDVYVMFYNRRLLESEPLAQSYADKYGHLPQPARTFEELDRLMRHYHSPKDNRYGGALFRTPGFLAWEWWIRFHAKGRWPFDEQMRPQIDTVEGVEALQDMVDATRFLHPKTATANLVDNWKVFAGGNVLCNIGWGGSQKYFRSQSSGIRDDVLVAPTPGAQFGDDVIEFGHFNWGWNYAVPRTSKYAHIAALFAVYATDPEVSTVAVRAIDGFFDPFHATHYDDPQIQQVYGQNFLDVHKKMLETAIPDLYLDGKTRYLNVLDEQILHAIEQESRPDVALRAAASLWRALTDELGRAGQTAQWRALRTRYPEALRRRLR